MYRIEEDLHQAVHQVNNLERYLYLDKFSTSTTNKGLSVKQNTMSLGSVIATIQRLRRLRCVMDTNQRAQVGNICTIYLLTFRDNKDRFVRTLGHELHTRTNKIQDFLTYAADAIYHIDGALPRSFEPYLLDRTIVQAMLCEVAEHECLHDELIPKMHGIDGKLARVLDGKQGFCWSGILQIAYPEAIYWWLYRSNETEDMSKL